MTYFKNNPTEEDFKDLQLSCGTKHQATPMTYVFRLAISDEGPQAYNWSDKPHRLVYDLCSRVEELEEYIKNSGLIVPPDKNYL